MRDALRLQAYLTTPPASGQIPGPLARSTRRAGGIAAHAASRRLSQPPTLASSLAILRARADAEAGRTARVGGRGLRFVVALLAIFTNHRSP